MNELTPEQFISDTEEEYPDYEITKRKIHKDKDEFYYVVNFNGSDRCEVESLELEYNTKQIEKIYSAGPCLVFRYKKVDENKQAFLVYREHESQTCSIYELV